MTKEEMKGYSLRITQSSKSQLVVITYEIIVNYLNAANEAFKAGRTEDFIFNIKKAKHFVDNLISSLDLTYQLSLELLSIYLFINRSLVEAIVKKKDSQIEKLVCIMDKLRAGFEEISKEDKSGPVIKDAPKVYAGLTYSKDKLNEYTPR